MWHKAVWMGHAMRLKVTRKGLPVKLAKHYTTRGVWLIARYIHTHINIYIEIVTEIQRLSRANKYTFDKPISKTNQIRQTRYMGHCEKNKYELISDVLLRTSSHGRTSVGRLARIYLQQLCTDTGCSQEDLPEAWDDRSGWRERERESRVSSTTW